MYQNGVKLSSRKLKIYIYNGSDLVLLRKDANGNFFNDKEFDVTSMHGSLRIVGTLPGLRGLKRTMKEAQIIKQNGVLDTDPSQTFFQSECVIFNTVMSVKASDKSANENVEHMAEGFSTDRNFILHCTFDKNLQTLSKQFKEYVISEENKRSVLKMQGAELVQKINMKKSEAVELAYETRYGKKVPQYLREQIKTDSKSYGSVYIPQVGGEGMDSTPLSMVEHLEWKIAKNDALNNKVPMKAGMQVWETIVTACGEIMMETGAKTIDDGLKKMSLAQRAEHIMSAITTNVQLSGEYTGDPLFRGTTFYDENYELCVELNPGEGGENQEVNSYGRIDMLRAKTCLQKILDSRNDSKTLAQMNSIINNVSKHGKDCEDYMYQMLQTHFPMLAMSEVMHDMTPKQRRNYIKAKFNPILSDKNYNKTELDKTVDLVIACINGIHTHTSWIGAGLFVVGNSPNMDVSKKESPGDLVLQSPEECSMTVTEVKRRVEIALQSGNYGGHAAGIKRTTNETAANSLTRTGNNFGKYHSRHIENDGKLEVFDDEVSVIVSMKEHLDLKPHIFEGTAHIVSMNKEDENKVVENSNVKISTLQQIQNALMGKKPSNQIKYGDAINQLAQEYDNQANELCKSLGIVWDSQVVSDEQKSQWYVYTMRGDSMFMDKDAVLGMGSVHPNKSNPPELKLDITLDRNGKNDYLNTTAALISSQKASQELDLQVQVECRQIFNGISPTLHLKRNKNGTFNAKISSLQAFKDLFPDHLFVRTVCSGIVTEAYAREQTHATRNEEENELMKMALEVALRICNATEILIQLGSGRRSNTVIIPVHAMSR